MARRLLSLYLVGILAAVLVAGAGAVALGYIGQTNVKVILSGSSGTVKCNRSATITAKVVSAEKGKPIANQVVRWSLASAQSGGDGLSASSTLTNRNGLASVSISFGPVAGARTVAAAAGNASSGITVRCAGGLPKTSVRPPEGHAAEPSGALLRPPAVLEATTDGPIPMSRLRVDRLGIELPVIEGDGVTVPEGAASHYPGTAWPGDGSNIYVYAHARAQNFLELWQVRTGDTVKVEMADGRVMDYRVSEIHPVVKWDALEYLAPTTSEQLTLQTSLWYADTAPRFVVIALPSPGA